MNNKVKVVKGLSNIEQLFNRNLPAPANRVRIDDTTIRTSIVIEEDDTISMTIWKVMQDNKPRTLNELMVRVESIVGQQAWYDNYLIDRLNIQAVVHKLVTDGVLLRDGSIKNFKYTIAPNAPMPNSPMGETVQPKKDKVLEDVTALWPDDYLDFKVLHVDHGLDTCIWKICSDYKSHNLGEIAEKVAKVGFKINVVKDRVTTLARKSGWFRRTGGRTTIMYTLNKTCQMPAPTKFKEPVVEQGSILKHYGVDTSTLPALAPLQDAEYVSRKKQLEQAAKQPAMDHAIPVPVTTVEKPVKAVPNRSIGEVEGRSFIVPQPDYPVVKEAFDFCGDALITSKDTLMKAIIKTMLDGKQYTSGDIIVLLDDYLKETGRQKHSIYTTLNTAMTRYDWVLRIESSSGLQYHLKPAVSSPTIEKMLDRTKQNEAVGSIDGIHVPFFKVPEKVTQPVVAKQVQLDILNLATPGSNTISIASPNKDFDGDYVGDISLLLDRNPSLNHNNPITAEKENSVSTTKPTMFEVIIRIKGKDYTPEQARRVAKAIETAKATEDNTDDILSVRQQVVLSGNPLTDEEITLLHKEFVEFGFTDE